MKTLQTGTKVLIEATVEATTLNGKYYYIKLPSEERIMMKLSDLTVCETAEEIDLNNFCIDITNPVNAELLPGFMKDMAHVSDPRYKYYGKERGNRFGSLQNTRAHLNLTTLPELQKQHPGVFNQSDSEPTPSFKAGQEVEVQLNQTKEWRTEGKYSFIGFNLKGQPIVERLDLNIIESHPILADAIRPIPAQPTERCELEEILGNIEYELQHHRTSASAAKYLPDFLAWHQKHSGRVEVSVPSDEEIKNKWTEIAAYGYSGSLPDYAVMIVKHFMTRKEQRGNG